MNQVCLPAVCFVLTGISSGAIIDLSFDSQTFDPILGTPTTEAGHLPWNGAGSAPAGFGTFTAHTSASVSNSGISLSMTGLLGSWSGNSSVAVGTNELRADYFIVGTGSTATLMFSGLDPNASYDITFTHGNAEPAQFRGLDVVGQGITGSDIDNGLQGTPAATYSIVSNGSGEISVGLTGQGVQEGNLAGVRIAGGVPEPSGFVLTLFGATLAGLRRRRG